MSVFSGDNSGGVAYQKKAMLYCTCNGVVGSFASDDYKPRVALGWGGKLLGIGAGTIIYYDGTKTETSAAGGSMSWGVTSPPQAAFLDSNNNVYFGFNQNAGTDGVWRLANGNDPLTAGDWDDMSAVTTAGTRVNSFCEDDDGYVYFVEYTHNVMWRVANDGTSAATKIVNGSFPGSGTTPSNHLHSVFYDKYRKVLIALHGDATGSYPEVSGDNGATWSTWTTTGFEQGTSACFDSDYIYLVSDINGDRGVYRSSKLVGSGVSTVVGATVTRVFDPGVGDDITGVFGNDLTFTGSTITSPVGGTDLSVFSLSDVVCVYGSDSNDGIHTVHGSTAPTATVLTLTAAVTAETPDAATKQIRVSLNNEAGHSWFSHVDNNGWVIVQYGAVSTNGVSAKMYVSEDQGTTWREIARAGNFTTGAPFNSQWGHELATYSHLNTDWDGYFYQSHSVLAGGATTFGMLQQWKLIDGNLPIKVDTTNGSDILQADPQGAGWNQPYDFPFKVPPRLKFETDYTSNYAPTSTGVTIDKNGVLVSTPVVTPVSAEYTGVDAWAPAGFTGSKDASITVANNDTAKISTGAYSFTPAAGVKYCVATKTLDIGGGTAVWIENDYHIETAWQNTTTFMRLAKSTNFVSVNANSNGEYYISWRNDDATGNTTDIFYPDNTTTRSTLPVDTTFNLILMVDRAAAGTIKLFVDGVLVQEIIGINTAPTTPIDVLSTGLSTFNTDTKVHFANGKTSYADTRLPTAVQLLGSSQKVIDVGTYS